MIAFGIENLAEDATITGGSFETDLPASFAGTREYSEVAQTTDDAEASSTVHLDLGSAKQARALIVYWDNISSAGTVKWDIGTTLGDDDVHAGSATARWAAAPRRYHGKQYDGRQYSSFFILPEAVSGRHHTVTINDTTNALGYLRFKLFICDLLVPSRNASYGRQHGLEALGSKRRSAGGTLQPTPKRVLKNTTFQLGALLLAEGGAFQEMLNLVGTTEPMAYFPDITDRAAMQQFGFIGTFDELGALEDPFFQRNNQSYRATEA